ncbi:hypothetical protein GBAR_LOCUS24482 [Geodia barretti]|uniref:Uncharacterized protein n=1 Tax=Geodia barretti TaxID=519541 RepID=A0AA35T9V1_GEOBA|nr:hypothetical protein GBAR_LOCUS24482 [Geodia barretti]
MFNCDGDEEYLFACTHLGFTDEDNECKKGVRAWGDLPCSLRVVHCMKTDLQFISTIIIIRAQTTHILVDIGQHL